MIRTKHSISIEQIGIRWLSSASHIGNLLQIDELQFRDFWVGPNQCVIESRGDLKEVKDTIREKVSGWIESHSTQEVN